MLWPFSIHKKHPILLALLSNLLTNNSLTYIAQLSIYIKFSIAHYNVKC